MKFFLLWYSKFSDQKVSRMLQGLIEHLRIFKWTSSMGCVEGPEVQSTDFSKGHRLISVCHVVVTTPETPVPGKLVHSSGFHAHKSYVRYTDMQGGKVYIHITSNWLLNLKSSTQRLIIFSLNADLLS